MPGHESRLHGAICLSIKVAIDNSPELSPSSECPSNIPSFSPPHHLLCFLQQQDFFFFFVFLITLLPDSVSRIHHFSYLRKAANSKENKITVLFLVWLCNWAPIFRQGFCAQRQSGLHSKVKLIIILQPLHCAFNISFNPSRLSSYWWDQFKPWIMMDDELYT